MLNAQQVTSSMYIILNKFLKCKPTQYTRPLRNVSCHSEYLKNRWPDLDVPWQPVGGDLTGIHEQSLSAGARQSAVRCRWLNLCTVWPSHSKWPSQQISESASMRLPILQLSCGLFFGKTSLHPGLSAPLQHSFGSLGRMAFPKLKITVESEEICECDGHTVHKLSQRRLTTDWLAPRESDCSWVHSNVSSNWLLSYFKATRPVL